MKRFIILATIAPALALGSVVDMQKLFDQKQYTQVIGEAKKSTSEYGNAKLHFLWAKSAEALGRTEEAMAAYERALMIDPAYHEARMALAKLYADTGRMALAEQLTKDTEDYRLTSKERSTISSLIVEDNGLFSVSAKLGFGYDSNINVSPGDLDLLLSTKEISTRFARLQLGLSYTHYFENMEDLYLRSVAALSYQSNEESYYNLFEGLLSTGLGYKGDNYEIFVPLEYKRMYYLEDDFLQSIGVKPSLNYVISSSLVGNVNAKYTKRSYIQQADKRLDDSVLGVGAGLYWLLGQNLVYAKADYGDYSAKYADPLPYVDKHAAKLTAGFTYQVNDKLKTSGEYTYRNTSYDDTIPNTAEKRSDDYQEVLMNVSRTFWEDFEAVLNYTYAHNDSNYDFAQYRKHIIMCNINYRY